MRSKRFVLLALLGAGLACAGTPASANALGVTWMRGFAAPDTPARYDKVGVIKVGPRSARNILVLAPGTSAGGSYFVPLAKWIVAKAKGWQVWSLERRENLLEDQSLLNQVKVRKATLKQLFDYYLRFLTDPSVRHHFRLIADSTVEFAKQWGMRVAAEDLHRVIADARKLGGKVVLGGHSLGGSVVTAYATWDFHGHPGADDLAGLLYIDGASDRAVSAASARQGLRLLDATTSSPWLSFGGIPAPFAGVYNATGSLAALIAPNAPSRGQEFALLPSALKPKVRVTNLGEYGFALNVGTSPPGLIAAQAHLGQGVAARGPLHGWNGSGALTPIGRYAAMFSGLGLSNVDGTEWYFPARLTLDTGAVANGNPNPAQRVLGLRATMGHRLPRRLLIYALGARLGGQAVLDATKALAAQSHIPHGNLTLINRQRTYAHNDPIGAYPHNVFFANLLRFLNRVSP